MPKLFEHWFVHTVNKFANKLQLFTCMFVEGLHVLIKEAFPTNFESSKFALMRAHHFIHKAICFCLHFFRCAVTITIPNAACVCCPCTIKWDVMTRQTRNFNLEFPPLQLEPSFLSEIDDRFPVGYLDQYKGCTAVPRFKNLTLVNPNECKMLKKLTCIKLTNGKGWCASLELIGM